jgi:general stress protein YciG
MAMRTDTQIKPKRGFAAMSPEKRREIAAKGGASVPAEKRSFSQNRDLAASAGRVGGSASPSLRRDA